MKITRIIAVGIILGSVALTGLGAETLRNAQPPAEFPPSTFKGKQYVDSRGCIYIRAGIDGNVTWVPRVSRNRKQVCGYKPTAVAGTGSRPKAKAATVITVPSTPTPPAAAKPAATAAAAKPAAAAPAKAKPAATAQPRATTPRRTTVRRTTAPSPAPTPAPVTVPTTRTTTARPAPTTAPAKTRRRPSTAPVATVAPPAIAPRTAPPAASGCSNASAFSQKYINKKGVRCGPQAEQPVTYGQGWDSSSLSVSPDTRVVPRHVYERRQNTTDVTVPAGYKTVWKDDRLNPHRAERTLRPSVVQTRLRVPAGYKVVEREDDRMNPNRGARTAEGDSQTNRLWAEGVPRRLAPVPYQGQVVTLSSAAAQSAAEANAPFLIRVSSRSAPDAPQPRSVRKASATANERPGR